jgi:Leucine-rich repeat (LRR) protein
LDSLWSKEDWDKIKSALPETVHLQGKVVLTTREKDVAQYCCSNGQGDLIQLQPLTHKNAQLLNFQLMFNRTSAMLSWWNVLAIQFLDVVFGAVTKVILPGFKYIEIGLSSNSTFVKVVLVIILLMLFPLVTCLLLIICGLAYFMTQKLSTNKSLNYTGLICWIFFLHLNLHSPPVPLELKFLCGAMVDESVNISKVLDLLNALNYGSVDGRNEHQRDGRLLKVIEFCYEIMSSSLKKCTQDLSVLPECYVVNRKKITRKWVALDLISPAPGLSRGEVAESYFDKFVVKGFIEPESANTWGKIKYCRINSVLKEFLAKKLRDDDKRSYRDVNSFQLYDTKPSDALKCFRELSSKNPESLIILDLEGCKGLKKKDLNSVCRFVNLKLLSLRNTDVSEIPQKIRKLHSLETLDIRQTGIEKVPEGILDLHRLKHIFAGCINKPESGTGGLNLSTSPIEVIAGMEKMSSLQTLAYVNATKASKLLLSVRELSQLKKLGLVIRETKINSKPLCISLMMLSNSLLSLSIFDEREENSLEFLEYLCFPPVKLESLTLRGNLGRLPQWIGDHKRLTKLTIADTQLRSDAIRLIGKIPTLLCLKLYSNSYAEQDLTLAKKEFPVLRGLIIHCDTINKISFEKGTTPRLEVFRWVISKSLPKDIDGIDNLRKLKEVSLIGDLIGDPLLIIECAVKRHSNYRKNTLVFEKICVEKEKKKELSLTHQILK